MEKLGTRQIEDVLETRLQELNSAATQQEHRLYLQGFLEGMHHFGHINEEILDEMLFLYAL